MLAYKTTVLNLIALFGLPALGEANCRSVSYDEFLETRAPNANAELGPRGLYARTLDGRCILVDAAVDGEFAKRHSDAHADLMDHIKRNPVGGLEFLGAAPANPLKRRAVACGANCGNNFEKKRCTGGCSCQLSSTYCIPGGCYDTYTCK
jgi:hypothetical protein